MFDFVLQETTTYLKAVESHHQNDDNDESEVALIQTLFNLGLAAFAFAEACRERDARIAPAASFEYPSPSIPFCTALKPGCFAECLNPALMAPILSIFKPRQHQHH
jgi:hypothetical protein